MNRMSKNTFGYAYDQALKTKCIDQKICDRIGEVLEDRNYIIHQIFRGDTTWMYDYDGYEDLSAPVDEYLGKVVDRSYDLANDLEKIMNDLENRYKMIKS